MSIFVFIYLLSIIWTIFLDTQCVQNKCPNMSRLFGLDAVLSCKGDFSVEIERWRVNVSDHSGHQNIPGLQSALKLADKDHCHTIFTLLIVLPVTSVCCERSFSALRHE